jgi:hypothetical protein
MTTSSYSLLVLFTMMFSAAQIVARLDPHLGPVNVAIPFRIGLTSALDMRRAFVVSYQFAIDTPTALWERGDKSSCVGVVLVEGEGYCT